MVMDNSKRNPSTTANSKNPDFKESSQVNKETNENEGLPSRRGFAKVLSPVPKNKILAERNFVVDDAPPPPPPFLAMETTTTPKVQGIRLILSSSGPGRSPSPSSSVAAYDPVTNFTSPRPKFLRYNPNRRREILQRMEVGDTKDFEWGGTSSTSSDQSGNEEEEDDDEEEGLASLIESSASPPKPTSQEEDTNGGVEKDDSDYEVDDAMEEEVEERPSWSSRSRTVWKLFLIFGLFFISCHYLFPTTPSVVTPPFHQEVETGGSEEITIPQRPTNWSYVLHLLTSHMGVSDLCLSGGEMMCPIDGHTCSSSLVVDDDEEEEIHMGSPPAIREEEGFANDLVMSDEVTGMVLEEEEDSSLQAQGADTSVAIEERVDLSTSPALFEQPEDGSQREECEQKVEDQAPSEVEKRVQLLEETSHSTPAQNAPQVGQASEESRFSIISESAFRWNHHLVSRQLAPSLIFIWMSLLTALFGFKYFLKPSSPPPPLLPCSSKSSIDEKKTDASVTTVVEEMRNIERRMKPAVEEEEKESRDIDKEDLDRLREKYGGESLSSYARRQMLGDQFSLAESEIGGGGGGQTFKRIEPEREEGGSDECQYNKMMRSSTRKSPPSSSNKQLHPSSTKSDLEGSYRPGKKLRKTDQDSSNKSEEEKMVVATPLRRSDRLRKRVTSP